ncbi:uncharacterized protein LOC129972278 [Argiope bruennichi]|uniref:Uncharacterized protein n=1 Tax=Argiope bruennichi TaxID=94029 RepID=A0A8T0F970_ARGBR|nr:uncharacterized protein LOC129972278 [Argiope bruennichi]KAF8787431.1 hypothetical protein HNY73_009031 [Argiope bruennichi]
MKASHVFTSYLMLFFIVVANIELVIGGEYAEYPSYEGKHYEHHHHDYHPPPKKSANVDINIPLDFGTIAKLGVLGLTQLKLLMALGKVAGAGLGVSALGLGQLGKIALKIGPAHKGAGIAIDLGGGHSHHHEAKSYSHYEPVEKHYHVPSEKHY